MRDTTQQIQEFLRRGIEDLQYGSITDTTFQRKLMELIGYITGRREMEKSEHDFHVFQGNLIVFAKLLWARVYEGKPNQGIMKDHLRKAWAQRFMQEILENDDYSQCWQQLKSTDANTLFEGSHINCEYVAVAVICIAASLTDASELDIPEFVQDNVLRNACEILDQYT